MDETQLTRLASTVISWIRPNRYDIESVEDCFQTAYLSGLQALRNAQAKQLRPSERYLMLCMQSAVYRSLKKEIPTSFERPPEISDNHDIFMKVDSREWCNAHLAILTAAQKRTLLAYYGGETAKEIAAREGIKYRSVHTRIKIALDKLRAADDEVRSSVCLHLSA